MSIKIVLFAFAIIGGFIFSSRGNTKKNRKKYIIFMIIILGLESSLRGLSVGSDTMNYYYYFTEHGNMKWDEIWNSFVDRYINRNTDFDVGFAVYNKLIYSLTSNFSIYLGVCALFYFFPLGKLIYRYADDFYQLIFCFTLYIALFNIIAMSGVRNQISLGCTMAATMAFIDKKYRTSCFIILFSVVIHMSTLLWLLIPALSFFNIKHLRIFHLTGLALAPVVIAASGLIIVYMGNFVGMEKYAAYGMNDAEGGAMTFTIMIELISLFCLIAYRKSNFEKGSYMHILYTALPCFSFFAPLITNNGSMIRISQYFHIYVMSLFPFAIDLLFDRNRKTIYLLLCIILLLLSFKSGSEPYYFIWEDNQFSNGLMWF